MSTMPLPPDNTSLIGVLVERVTNLTTTVERVEKVVVKAVDDHEARLREQAQTSVTQALKTLELEGRLRAVEDQQKENMNQLRDTRKDTSARSWALLMFGLSAGFTILVKLIWG